MGCTMKDKAGEKRIKDSKRTHPPISKSRKKDIKDQMTSQREKQSIRDLKTLSKMAMGLVDLPFEQDIYQFLAEQLKELVGNCLVIMNSFDETSQQFCVRSVLGIGTQMEKVLKFLGKHPVGMLTPIDDQARKGLTSGKLEKVSGGLYELSVGSIPEAACKAIEKALGLGDAYAMGFYWRKKLFGSAVMLLRKGAEIQDPSIIETFIRQASIALQRRQAEEALRMAKDDLERRVKARTSELEEANKKLQLEIVERQKVESAMQESEHKYRNLVERANDGIAIVQDNLIKYINPCLEEFIGYSLEELVDNPFAEYIGTEELPKLTNTYQRRMKGEAVPSVYETVIKHKDGHEILIEVNASLIQYQGKPADLAIIRDITQRKKEEERLRVYQEKLRRLASRLSLAEQHERQRIATLLHDRISQTLALSKIKLGMLHELTSDTEFTEEIEEIRELLEKTIQETRSLTFELSPPILNVLSFESAVEWLCEKIQKEHDIILSFKDDNLNKPLEDDIRAVLFQAVSELLVNVVKHAKAQKAKISIQKEDKAIRVMVEDDGIGFDLSKSKYHFAQTGGFGLFNISERLEFLGGSIGMESKPNRGTCVTLKAPLKIKKKASKEK